jgi:acetolactate synthase-1/3 small subunit
MQEDYDVYLAEQQPLQEGEEKHIISVFVADESGLINRVAGVFARRGEPLIPQWASW